MYAPLSFESSASTLILRDDHQQPRRSQSTRGRRSVPAWGTRRPSFRRVAVERCSASDGRPSLRQEVHARWVSHPRSSASAEILKRKKLIAIPYPRPLQHRQASRFSQLRSCCPVASSKWLRRPSTPRPVGAATAAQWHLAFDPHGRRTATNPTGVDPRRRRVGGARRQRDRA